MTTANSDGIIGNKVVYIQIVIHFIWMQHEIFIYSIRPVFNVRFSNLIQMFMRPDTLTSRQREMLRLLSLFQFQWKYSLRGAGHTNIHI